MSFQKVLKSTRDISPYSQKEIGLTYPKSFYIGELHRVIMELTRELTMASRVLIGSLTEEELNDQLCERYDYWWHFSDTNKKQIWVYKDLALKEIIKEIELNIDEPLNKWAHLKIQGFSDHKVLEIIKLDR